MPLTLYQVDAFTDTVFKGNPAAVIPLEHWLPDETLLNIAIENNLSETAYFTPEGDDYRLRWFTPGGEVDLCGHATLATAYTLFEELNYDRDTITFNSRSGPLHVTKKNDGYMMDFPIWEYKKAPIPDVIAQAFGQYPVAFFTGYDDIAVFERAEDIRDMQPDFNMLKNHKTRGVLITAPGDHDYDFISRAFFPRLNINEDPVTGSAHCLLAPYWSERLKKKSFKAHQASERGGDLYCEIKGDRLEITGNAALYMKGEIYV